MVVVKAWVDLAWVGLERGQARCQSCGHGHHAASATEAAVYFPVVVGDVNGDCGCLEGAARVMARWCPGPEGLHQLSGADTVAGAGAEWILAGCQQRQLRSAVKMWKR